MTSRVIYLFTYLFILTFFVVVVIVLFWFVWYNLFQSFWGGGRGDLGGLYLFDFVVVCLFCLLQFFSVFFFFGGGGGGGGGGGSVSVAMFLLSTPSSLILPYRTGVIHRNPLTVIANKGNFKGTSERPK